MKDDASWLFVKQGDYMRWDRDLFMVIGKQEGRTIILSKLRFHDNPRYETAEEVKI